MHTRLVSQSNATKTNHIVHAHYTHTSPFAPVPTLCMLMTKSDSADGEATKKASRRTSSKASGDAPESVVRRTQVRVAGLTTQDTHTVYLLEVNTGNGATHMIAKRYSEIHSFRAELLAIVGEKKSHCGHGPCAQLSQLAQIKFPRRQLRLPGLLNKREPDIDVAQQRAELLERFLQALLRVYHKCSRRQLRVCSNAKCAPLDLIQKFLDLEVAQLNIRGRDPVVFENAHKTYEAAREQLTEVMLPGEAHSFPELAFSTVSGDQQTPLEPIDELIPESAVI